MIKKIRRDTNPDFLFIEPYELVITDEIRVAASLGLRDVDYEVGPFITLVDAETFDFSWQERNRLILNHIIGADMIAISRSDLTQPEQLEAIRETLKNHVNNNQVLSLSAVLGHGIKEVMDSILVM